MKHGKKAVPETYEPASGELVVRKNKKVNFLALILCLIISVFVWLYVMNMETAEEEKSFSVPVVLRGESELMESTGMSVIDFENRFVKVTVAGTRREVNNIDEKDIVAYIDVSGLGASDIYALNIRYENISDSIDVISSEPALLTVYADVMETRDIPLEIKTYQAIKSEYTMSVTPSVDSIQVTGPCTELDAIATAILKLDLGMVTTSVVKSGGEIVLTDKAGNIVTSEHVSHAASDVEVRVSVSMTKALPIVVKNSNETKVIITPKVESLSVVGDPGILEAMTALEVEVDISRLNADTEITQTISLPEGLSLASGENADVKFSVAFVRGGALNG